MKKLGAVFILLVLCALCGCSNETGETSTKNNITISSESSNTGALTSAYPTYIVGDSEVSDKYKNDPTVVVVPESEANSSEEVFIDDMPEWTGKVFKYDNTICDSLDLFVDWIKSDGKLEIDGVRYDQWEYSDAFLETVSKEKEILLPIAKNGSEFFNVRISANSSWYIVIYDNTLDSGETVSLDIGLILDSKNDEYKSAFEFAQSQPVNEGVKLYKSKHSIYGEYCYKNYTKDTSGNRKNITTAYIKTNGAYVTIDVWGDVHEKPWNPQYFDYFDFEKVSLK